VRGFLITAAILLGLIVAWWLIFRIALKYPNNDNEFSRDDHGGGGTSA
jgi:hypothetical protein